MTPIERASLSTRRLWMALILAAAVLLGAHTALTVAVTGETVPEVIAIDAAFAVLLLGVTGWFLGRLRRERQRAAVESLLLDVLSTPRNIRDTATEALRLITEHRLGDAASVAIAGEEDGPLRPLAATGYPRGWLESAPAARVETVTREAEWKRAKAVHPWIEPVASQLGGRPWVAHIPLHSGGDPIGLLLVASRRPTLLEHPGLRALLAERLGAAFDHAALYEAAYRRERDLEDQEVRRREFIASISHEIRTPLTSIQAFAELLQLDQGALDDTARDLVASLSGGVERLSGLVNDLIELGRSSDVPLEPQRRDVDVVQMLRAAEATVRPAMMLRGQTFILDLPVPELHAFVDPRMMEQAVLNLLSNAARYTPAGGQITIQAYPWGDGNVRIEVSDSGPGIAPEERERIFEPYYRVKETERAVPGSGLGLAVARRLVEACGGKIWAEAAGTGGARFCIEVRATA